MSKLSIVVGAGFSAPAGYPTSELLNKRLMELQRGTLYYSLTGELKRHEGTLPQSFLTDVDLCIDLIHHFERRMGSFYYKVFYDYLIEGAYKDESINEVIDNKYYNKETILYSLGAMRYIFKRLIDLCNYDNNGNYLYNSKDSFPKELFAPYEKFFASLGEYESIDIYSLNDDLLADGLRFLDCIDGDFSDGFEYAQPAYKGEVWEGYGEVKEIVELPQYTGKFDKRVNLHKLRGSRDFYALYKPLEYESFYGKEVFVKVDKKIDRISYNGVYLPFNYRGEFLSGMSVESIRRNYPIYCNLVMDNFRKSLEESDKLMIIGYGGGDYDVNQQIYKYFQSNKPSVVIDPNPSSRIVKMAVTLNSQVIRRPFEKL